MPKMKMTARGIAAIQPPKTGQIDYWDYGLTGLGLRVSAGGKKTWVYMYRHKETGDKRRHTIGAYPATTFSDVREEAKQLAARVAKGGDPAKEKNDLRRAGTFAELAQIYLVEKAKGAAFSKWEKNGKKGAPPAPAKRSWFKDERIINYDLLPAFGRKKACSIVQEDVDELSDKIVERGSPIQANRTREILNGIYNWALKKPKYKRQFQLVFNPCFGLGKPSEESSRDRVLSESEIKKIWCAAEHDCNRNAAAVHLQLMTGQRGGEVLSICWNDVDLDGRWWEIPASKSKNKLAHRVPLSDAAVALLTRLKADLPDDEQWVFPKKNGGGSAPHIQKAIQRIRDATEITDFTQHDFRRTVATRLGKLKVSRFVVKKVLNHVDPDVTARYDHYRYDKEKRKALNLWAKKLTKILSEE